MKEKICQTCGCMYLWAHGCGESCLCVMCWECEKVEGECVCEKVSA